MLMCRKPENPHFSHIFFEHGYLTYLSTYVLENLDICCWDMFGGKRVSKF